MKNKLRAIAVVGLMIAGALFAPAAANAHYDPWNTHWDGGYNYRSCSWFDSVFRGCKTGYVVMPIIYLR